MVAKIYQQNAHIQQSIINTVQHVSALAHFQGEFYRMVKTSFEYTIKYVHRVSQEFRSILRDLIPELMLSQKVIYTWVHFTTVQEL